jgi:hypothetical protein
VTASFYTRFANLPDRLAARGIGVGGPDFTGIRTSGGSPAVDATETSLSSRRLVFIAAALETFGRTFPEVLVWRAPWLVFARLGVDVQAQDVYSDGTLAYLITGQPVTHYGFVLGPAMPTQVPVTVPGGGFFLLESDDFLLLETGDHLILEAA